MQLCSTFGDGGGMCPEHDATRGMHGCDLQLEMSCVTSLCQHVAGKASAA